MRGRLAGQAVETSADPGHQVTVAYGGIGGDGCRDQQHSKCEEAEVTARAKRNQKCDFVA
jgi:hypothetical protein